MSKLSRSRSKPRPRSTKRQKASDTTINVHLISESTGGLARHMATVAMSQFPSADYVLHEHPFCTNIETLGSARKAIDVEASPLVFSALAQLRLQRSLANWCDRRKIEQWELMQPLIDFVAAQTGLRPVRDASRTHRCNDEYFRRMDAWEFTLQHDDNRRLETAGEADLILLGISRVGKTPLAAYLGSLGYRVANVAIAKKAAVPQMIREHREKTIGLTIDADRLAQIRKRRFEVNRIGAELRRKSGRNHSYYSKKTALEDVIFAEQQFRRLGLQTLDMTDLTVEESASRILNLLEIGQSD